MPHSSGKKKKGVGGWGEREEERFTVSLIGNGLIFQFIAMLTGSILLFVHEDTKIYVKQTFCSNDLFGFPWQIQNIPCVY